VVHRPGSRWRLDVGPYEVLVTGTRFDVSWDPTAERFRLAMLRGRVRVTGPLLAEGRSMGVGEVLQVSSRGRRLEVEGAPAATVRQAPIAPPAPATSSPGARPHRVPAAPPLVPSWRALAAAGRYREAIELVERGGFAAECERADASELEALGDAARLSGNALRAGEALSTLRRRFPGTGAAAAAAFALGRMAFDQRGAFAEAAALFVAYLDEAPAGPFAREAAGRLIEARRRAGDAAGARQAAQRYLERYPDGPHAELARRLTRE
jgi:transmembrane sensor